MVKSQIMSIPTPSSRLPDFEKPKICDGRVTGGLSIHSTHVQTSKWPVDGAFSNAQLTLDSLTTCTLQLCIYVYWMYIVCIYIYICIYVYCMYIYIYIYTYQQDREYQTSQRVLIIASQKYKGPDVQTQGDRTICTSTRWPRWDGHGHGQDETR